ncbi:NUDIX hydrolase [Vibrio spartinae]|uniref:Adenosine nucleotide hydrolase NudE n=1 Tax=Vibrio spartinae TaxID=1918945 RepID=A0ABX6QXW9_9VIBR|nr:NUDIX hydrolase [Vibrio spartinae]QMV13865.1 adenosine nucleotide hydrolase NudE [Vibrio spartinae]
MNKGNHKKGEIEIVQEIIEFENEYATLYNDDVIFPSGNHGKYLRFIWNAPYGVMIFAKDFAGRLLLVKNFRHGNRCWSWEIPKGFGERELTPLECGKKELFEETGCTGNNWKLYKSILENQSETYLFNVEVNGQTSVTNQENKEAIADVRFFEVGELQELLLSNEVTDPMTMFFIAQNLPSDV